MKWRSEPQVVESRTLRIASWGWTITGSLTVSVLMSLTPFQQIARMVARLEPVVLARAGGGILLERRDLAGLEQGLRAVQRLDDQGAGDDPLWRGRRRASVSWASSSRSCPLGPGTFQCTDRSFAGWNLTTFAQDLVKVGRVPEEAEELVRGGGDGQRLKGAVGLSGVGVKRLARLADHLLHELAARHGGGRAADDAGGYLRRARALLRAHSLSLQGGGLDGDLG